MDINISFRDSLNISTRNASQVFITDKTWYSSANGKITKTVSSEKRKCIKPCITGIKIFQLSAMAENDLKISKILEQLTIIDALSMHK